MLDPASSKDLLGTFGVNGKLFVAQLVNFVIVLIVMWRWVYRPLVAMMDTRAKEITDGLENAKAAKHQLSEAAADRERMRRETNASASAILAAAEQKTQRLHDEKLERTKEEIEKLMHGAKEQIQNERSAAFDALKGDIASLVALATQKVAGKMDEKAQRAHIAEAMKEL